MADKISKLKGVEECYVKLLTQIGKPLDVPLVSVELLGKNYKENYIKSEKIVNKTLNRLEQIQKDIIKNKFRLF